MTRRVEQRDFLRMPIDCDLTYSVVGDDRKFRGKVINLSSSGILFSASRMLQLNNLLTVVLTAPGTPPMHATVKVERVISNALFYEIGGTIRNKFD